MQQPTKAKARLKLPTTRKGSLNPPALYRTEPIPGPTNSINVDCKFFVVVNSTILAYEVAQPKKGLQYGQKSRCPAGEVTDDHSQGRAEGTGVAQPKEGAEEVAEAQEEGLVVDVVEEGEEDPAAEGLEEGAGDEDGLGANAAGVGGKDRGGQEGGKVGDAKHKAVLRIILIT